jgi:hypothetical protein
MLVEWATPGLRLVIGQRFDREDASVRSVLKRDYAITL